MKSLHLTLINNDRADDINTLFAMTLKPPLLFWSKVKRKLMYKTLKRHSA